MKLFHDLYGKINGYYITYKTKYRAMNQRERSRFLVLLISLILIADYLMFCYLSDKNIFNIFPALPKLDRRVPIHVYVPDGEAKAILQETRRMLVPDDKEVFAAMLYYAVAKGSMFDNTASIVPVKTYVRRAWVSGDNCVIDVDFEFSKGNVVSIPGSYDAFAKALEKTMVENINGVKNVYLVVNGIKRTAW